MRLKKIVSLIMVFLLSISLIGCMGVTEDVTPKQSKSLYDIAVEQGYEGTLDEWILSMFNKGEQKSVYEQAVEQGLFSGTLEDFIKSLKGETGNTSVQEASSFAINSVCSINCKFTQTRVVRDWFGRQYTEDYEYSSAGSGVIIEDDKDSGVAYIVTNYHVVYDASSNTLISDEIYVYLYGMEYMQYAIEAKYLGGTLTYDIAVLKIESDIYKNSGAYKATIGNSKNISAGSSIIAIGNPEAEGISITSGVISVENETITLIAADNRSRVDFRVIRIDAAVNGGNSGGGLFNTQGELIGIVNAKEVDEEIEGMCYAIPSNVAIAIANKIINTCDGEETVTITKVSLGASFEIASSRSEYNSETKKTSIIQTVSVSEVMLLGSSSGKLYAGDIILSMKIDGETILVDSLSTIEDALLKLSKGDVIIFEILRNNETKEVVITANNEVTLN